MTEQQITAPAPAEPAEAAPPIASPAITAPAITAPPVAAPPIAAPPVPDAPRPPRRALRAVARWTAALLVFGGLGTGTALAISSAERTDVPGLATEDDGRWEYPALSLPALPAGSPRPFTDANSAEIHHADLRKLLLPAPAGATPDKTLDGGWVKPERFLAEYRAEDRDELAQILVDTPPRHITARGWTMPDGTRARIYLVRFNSTAFATHVRDSLRFGLPEQRQLVGAQVTEFDATATFSRAVQGVVTYLHTEQASHGDAHTRLAYSLAGDTLALIVHERPGKAEAARIPFHQTVILQNQLLG